jgi:hypothetical protein
VKQGLLSGLVAVVEKTADEFEPGLLSPLTAADAIEKWARIEKIACAQKLRAGTRAEDLGLDAAGAVAGASGVPAGQARKQTKTARKAKGKTKRKFERGELSHTQAGAIAEATEKNPDAEDDLLALAERATTNELLNECERVKRRAMDDASLAAQQHQARSFRSWTNAMGMLCFAGALPPLIGAMFVAELERRADRLFRAQSRAKVPLDTKEQRMADALASLLDTAGTGKGPRTFVHLLVTKAAAERGWVEPGEKCETADGTQVPMAAVDDALLHKDTRVQEVTVDEVDVTTISTHKRYIPQRIRDALIAQGACCEICGSTKGLQIDHLDDFARGGPTELANLRFKCRNCHDLKSRRRYTQERDENGERIWEPVARARDPG